MAKVTGSLSRVGRLQRNRRRRVLDRALRRLSGECGRTVRRAASRARVFAVVAVVDPVRAAGTIGQPGFGSRAPYLVAKDRAAAPPEMGIGKSLPAMMPKLPAHHGGVPVVPVVVANRAPLPVVEQLHPPLKGRVPPARRTSPEAGPDPASWASMGEPDTRKTAKARNHANAAPRRMKVLRRPGDSEDTGGAVFSVNCPPSHATPSRAVNGGQIVCQNKYHVDFIFLLIHLHLPD